MMSSLIRRSVYISDNNFLLSKMFIFVPVLPQSLSVSLRSSHLRTSVIMSDLSGLKASAGERHARDEANNPQLGANKVPAESAAQKTDSALGHYTAALASEEVCWSSDCLAQILLNIKQ